MDLVVVTKAVKYISVNVVSVCFCDPKCKDQSRLMEETKRQ